MVTSRQLILQTKTCKTPQDVWSVTFQLRSNFSSHRGDSHVATGCQIMNTTWHTSSNISAMVVRFPCPPKRASEHCFLIRHFQRLDITTQFSCVSQNINSNSRKLESCLLISNGRGIIIKTSLDEAQTVDLSLSSNQVHDTSSCVNCLTNVSIKSLPFSHRQPGWTI